MTELEKIQYAKDFLDKLANGINPLDGTPLAEDDIANHVRLSRCFFFVSDVLRQVIENGGVVATKAPKSRKSDFSLNEEARKKLQPTGRPMTVSEIAELLNGAIDLETTKKISATAINQWLLDSGFLISQVQANGKNRKLPTEAGEEMGLFTEERSGLYGPYVVTMFSPMAQQFVYDNLESVVASANRAKELKKAIRAEMKAEARAEKDPLADFHNRPWTPTHDDNLIEMHQKQIPISEIAFALKRTESGVRDRLRALGLIE